MDDFKLIKNTKRFFIHRDGYAFKVYKRKDIIIPLNIVRGVPRVKIESKKLNLVLLMLEYFYEKELPDYYKYSFKVVDNKLPIKNIKLKILDKDSSLDEKNIFFYKCKEKSSAQNSRAKHQSTITDVDVLNCLKRTEFKCTYCGDNLNSNWHLDHVTPLALGGLNSSINITPSCKACNLMKGALPLSKFLQNIEKINNYYGKYSL